MKKRVLIVRPEPGASKTARRVEALGHEALVLPLTEIRTVELTASALKKADKSFDLVAVTSGNAVRHAPQAMLARVRHLPCFAVGEETAAAARKAGFAIVHAGSGNAEGLAEAIAANTPLRARVLYLCGKVRRPDFEAAIEAGGRTIRALETYDTVETKRTMDQVAKVIGRGPVDTVLLHSAASVGPLLRLMQAKETQPALGGTTIICISRRVAEALDGAAGRVLVAVSPDDNAMLALMA